MYWGHNFWPWKTTDFCSNGWSLSAIMMAKPRLSGFSIKELQVLEILMTCSCQDQESNRINKDPYAPWAAIPLSKLANTKSGWIPRVVMLTGVWGRKRLGKGEPLVNAGEHSTRVQHGVGFLDTITGCPMQTPIWQRMQGKELLLLWLGAALLPCFQRAAVLTVYLRLTILLGAEKANLVHLLLLVA